MVSTASHALCRRAYTFSAGRSAIARSWVKFCMRCSELCNPCHQQRYLLRHLILHPQEQEQRQYCIVPILVEAPQGHAKYLKEEKRCRHLLQVDVQKLWQGNIKPTNYPFWTCSRQRFSFESPPLPSRALLSRHTKREVYCPGTSAN